MSSPASAPEALPLSVRLDDDVPVIVLPDTLGFDTLRARVRDSLPDHLGSIAGRACRLDLGERDIALFDLRRLISLLREDFDLEITGLYARPMAIHRFAERELKLKLFPTETPEPEPLPEPEAEAEAEAEGLGPVDIEEAELIEAPPEEDAEETDEAPPAPDPGRRTHYVRRTLRSGAAVRFEGDVIVLGDVNPGAEVIASGNVLVLGALKGLAHAGATGDESAFLWALDLRPTQVRIARKIAIPPDAAEAGSEPLVARIADERIVIEPYPGGPGRRTRSPR